MKKFTLLAAAALAFVALGTSAAVAQDTTKKESKGEVAKIHTVASVVTAIDGSLGTAAKIGMLKPETKIELVDVGALLATSPADEATFKAAVEKNKDTIKQLRDELKKNDAIVQAISGSPQKPDIGDVVGAEVGEGDRLFIYFKKG